MKYQFKTNINCSGCVAKVTPFLNAEEGIEEWKVDTNNPGKVLTVETDKLTEEEIKQVITKAGFRVENINR